MGSPAHTFTTAGNPVCAAAALATLDVIEEEGLVERSQALGAIAQSFFQEMQAKYDFVGDVRLYGLDGGIDIVDAAGQPDNVAATKVIYKLFQLGVIMITLRGNILRFQPPLVITEDQLRKGLDQIAKAFEALEAGQLRLPQNSGKVGW